MVVAEISLSKDQSGVGWSILTLATAAGALFREITGRSRTETEAVWSAVDSLRGDEPTPSGVVAIYSTDGHYVARAPLWAVPAYGDLDWAPVPQEVVDITGFDPLLTGQAFPELHPWH